MELSPEALVKRRTPVQVPVRALDLARGIVQAPARVPAQAPVMAPVLHLLLVVEQRPVQAVIEKWSSQIRTDVDWTTKKTRNRLEMLRMSTVSERRALRHKLTRSTPVRPERQPVDSVSAVVEAVTDLLGSIRTRAVGILLVLTEVRQ